MSDQKPTGNSEACVNCKFYWKMPNGVFCRKGPPGVTNHIVGQHQLTKQPVSLPFSSFPPIRDEWWCGEFVRKLAVVS